MTVLVFCLTTGSQQPFQPTFTLTHSIRLSVKKRNKCQFSLPVDNDNCGLGGYCPHVRYCFCKSSTKCSQYFRTDTAGFPKCRSFTRLPHLVFDSKGRLGSPPPTACDDAVSDTSSISRKPRRYTIAYSEARTLATVG